MAFYKFHFCSEFPFISVRSLIVIAFFLNRVTSSRKFLNPGLPWRRTRVGQVTEQERTNCVCTKTSQSTWIDSVSYRGYWRAQNISFTVRSESSFKLWQIYLHILKYLDILIVWKNTTHLIPYSAWFSFQNNFQQSLLTFLY